MVSSAAAAEHHFARRAVRRRGGGAVRASAAGRGDPAEARAAWDKVREETLARQIKLGVVPANTQLTKRPEQIPAWDSLSADQKRVFARMMEVYAGALSHADYHIGRLLDALEESGQRDNTLIIFMMGDNGASAEGTLQGTTNEVAVNANGVTESILFLLSMIDELGGPRTYNHYPVGWAHAMDTPMQWTKQVASHFGALATAWRYRGRRASRTRAACARSSVMSSISCRRSTRPQKLFLQQYWTASSRSRSKGRAWSIPSTAPMRRHGMARNISKCSGTGRSTRMAGWRARRRCAYPG